MKTILLLFIFLFSFGISWDFGLAADDKPDYWPTKGWRSASPESQGIDSTFFVNMLDTIWDNDFAIDSVLVIRNGYIVLDAYRYPFNADGTRNIQSCSKSVVSALVGIAIDKGYIKDIHQRVLEFFPKRVAMNLDAGKKAMNLEHLLTMTHGLRCNDLYTMSGLTDMSSSQDWVQLILDVPMAEEPGTHFSYCNGAAFLLSAILQKKTGMSAYSFAEKNLFAPLGISAVHWPSNSQDITVGYSGLHLRPQDIAKIGYLYLNNGLWDGKQIISPQWIKASTRRHISTDSDLSPGYGYQWWIVHPGTYIALGYQGQYIMVTPEKNLIAVFTGSLSRKDIYIPIGLLAAYIIPSIKSQTPLPENPNAVKPLKLITNLWQNKGSSGREKIRKNTKKCSPRLKSKEYINSEYGFTVKYDPDFLVVDNHVDSPLLVRRRGLRGLPFFSTLVDDIPQNMALEYTADYLIEQYKRILPTIYHKSYHRIKEEKLIKLSDGTQANYVEINWNTQSHGILTTVCILVYNNKKMIGVVVGGTEDTPIKDLAGIAKSLNFYK